MELNINIEDIEFTYEEHMIQESRAIETKLDTQAPTVFEEEYLTLHSATFDKNLRKLVIEKNQYKK
jgi:hypothetical protein